MIGERAIASVGTTALTIARELGGILLLTGQVLRALIPPRMDSRELCRNFYKMGVRSVPFTPRSLNWCGPSGRTSVYVFGDSHVYGPEGINFYTRGKVVTSRWPDPATSTVDLGFPQTR